MTTAITPKDLALEFGLTEKHVRADLNRYSDTYHGPREAWILSPQEVDAFRSRRTTRWD